MDGNPAPAASSRPSSASKIGWLGAENTPSEVLLAELHGVLGRNKFAVRLAEAELTPQAFTDELRRLCVIVTPTDVLRIVPTDADDDHVLAAALSGGCDLIVSGDRRDLLPLASHAGIAIVTAREALERIGHGIGS